MKIPQSEQAVRFKENEDLLKRMNHGLSKKIASKEQEIRNIDALYDKKIEISNAEGEKDYLQNLEKNQQRIIAESNVFEEKIQGYKEQLEKAHKTVATEEKNLKETKEIKLENLKKQLNNDFEDSYLNLQESQRELQTSNNAKIKQTEGDAKIERLMVEEKAQNDIGALTAQLNQKEVSTEENYRRKLDNDVRLHNSEIARQKDELKKLMTMDAEKNKRLSNEQNRVSKEQLSFQEKHQKEMMIQREADFKIRYEKMVKEHDEILKNLSNLFSEDVRKMVEKTSTEKKQISDKTEDPFYQVDQLKPKMTEDLNEVTVSLPVAEYEKENVHLSAQGRNIKITLSRKYSESMNGEDGSMNRSTRSELFSKDLKSTDILSSQGTTQNYKDGILTFKIKKA